MSEKKRSIFLDIARGVGIILVVIGHTMSPVMTGNAVMEAAYKFSMCSYAFVLLFGGTGCPKFDRGGGILLHDLNLSSVERHAL